MIISKINSLELIDNLIDLKKLMDKIGNICDDKTPRVTEIKRITRKVLDKIKIEKIEEKERRLQFLKLKSKTYRIMKRKKKQIK